MKDFRVKLTPPDINSYIRLRKNSGLSARSLEAAAVGLPASLFAVTVYNLDGYAVGMGRVVGDGGCNFEVVDIAVEPAYQGKGLGRLIMEHVTQYLDANVPPGSYTCLIADTPWLYEKFGFEYCTPQLHGMHRFKRLG
ncbi:MAG: GNAT family N-acetyltransferase [Gammaproteobacteria bacterium]